MEFQTQLGSGRYVVKRLLGEGSQGTTYEATDSRTGRTVAVKRFDVRGARSWKDVELAEREARVLATLEHPLVPRYVDHFEESGALYLVMENVEGEGLDAIRKREGALPEAEVRRFLACAERALTYLHRRGSPVVHRDVKPSNVVRRVDGSYVFIDFGAVSDSLVRRGSSTIVGTIGYMAPEQLQGRAMPASDVYAVGATALAALTGVEPENLPHQGLRFDVRAALRGRASPELTVALERMLEPDPDVRAKSIGAALDGPAVGTQHVVRVERSGDSEDAAVKSLRGLLWALWGIGWIIVPLIFAMILGHAESIPLVMFGWLALNLIVTWHKGALLRLAVRRWNAESAEPAARPQQIDVESGRGRVRVHASELRSDEIVADAEVASADEDARQERAR
jgi:serine/threonine protein kinase